MFGKGNSSYDEFLNISLPIVRFAIDRALNGRHENFGEHFDLLCRNGNAGNFVFVTRIDQQLNSIDLFDPTTRFTAFTLMVKFNIKQLG